MSQDIKRTGILNLENALKHILENVSMTLIKCTMIASAFILVAGCVGDKFRQGLYQGMYEGCRLEEQQLMMPFERIGKPDMDFQQYSNALKERKEENR
jgi:hypothetical protein